MFRHMFCCGDSVATTLNLENYLLGSWGKSLNHSREVHSSVGVLIRRVFHDKYDTKIQA